MSSSSSSNANENVRSFEQQNQFLLKQLRKKPKSSIKIFDLFIILKNKI